MLRVINESKVNLRAVTKEMPMERCGLSCIGSPVVWVTVISVTKAFGLPAAKEVFCSIKCDGQSAKTRVSKAVNDEVLWNDPLIFYRRQPVKPIIVKVYNHNMLSANELIGMVELQARVNHAPSTLEVTLVDKTGALLSGRQLSMQILTEDDLMAV